MGEYCFLNGKILPTASAQVPVNDIGLLRGYGVFEVIRTFNKEPFLLHKHLARLRRSANALNLRVPYSELYLERIIRELIKKNGVREAQIRIVLTGGASVDSITFDPRTPTFYILVNEFPQLPQQYFDRGVKLQTLEYLRELPHVKSTNYLPAVRNYPSLKRKGFFELLYTWKGKVLECSTSNFFTVKRDVIATPKENVLLGTTRNFLIPLLKKEFKVEERDIRFLELSQGDETFLAATNKDVLPVVMIGKMRIGKGVPGPVTRRAMELFHNTIS